MHLIVSTGADITEVEHMTNVELGNLSFDSAVSGGMTGFMASSNFLDCCSHLRVMPALQDECLKRAQKKEAPGIDLDGYGDEDLQAGLLKALAQHQKPKIQEVDLAGAMESAGLARLFHTDQWPDSGAVRELASQLKHKKFVACDLHK